MALVLHISVSLLFFYVYNFLLKRKYNRIMGTPVEFKDWVWVYVKSLALIVVIPFVIGELLLLGLLLIEFPFIESWSYDRMIMILPYMIQLVFDTRIFSLIRNTFTK